jgi:chorismate mutase / prephenate dehydratase
VSEAGATTEGWSQELELLREQIEALDTQILDLIVERVRLARGVGKAKRAAGLPTLDPRREAAVVRRVGELARQAGLQDEDVRYIFWHLIGLARRAQMEEM